MSAKTTARVTTAWCVLSLGVLALSPLRALRTFEKTDFVAFLTGARILKDGASCLYCASSQAAAQTALLGHPPETGVIPFANPPLAAWALRPLAGLDVQFALAVFLAVSVVCLVLAAVVAWDLLDGLRPASRAMVVACSIAVLPGAEALAYGQWDPGLLLFVMLALRRLRNGDDLLAGILLSALWVKPQLVWLAVPVLLIARSWRAVAGLTIGASAWAATGVAIVGAGGVRDWWESIIPGRLQEAGRAVGLPALATDITGIHAAAFATSAVLAAIALVLVWRARERLDPASALGFGLVLSVVLSPHAFFTDVILVAPALLLIGRRRSSEAFVLSVVIGFAYLVDQALPTGAAHFTAVATLVLAARVLAPDREPAIQTRDQAAAVAA